MYCGDLFAVYTSVKTLCCIPDTNVKLDINLKIRQKNREKQRTDGTKKIKNTTHKQQNRRFKHSQINNHVKCNRSNTQIKRHRFSDWIKSKDNCVK